jgi:hypothetical protein
MYGVQYVFGDGPDKLGTQRYLIDVNRAEEAMWRPSTGSTPRLLSTPTVAEEILGELLDKDRERAHER